MAGRGRPAKYTPDDVDKAVELYSNLKPGTTKGTDVVGQIATELQQPKQSVYRMLRKGGIHKPRANKASGI